ncbi:MAG: PhzF family phenazine biosynthesis protein [Burkholderiaceae bacterium]|nr:PhzF family phenazine biosynthesis protein [Burkholderiaceae bacterium]
MTEYAFHTLDVFTTQRFAGNPLAVLPDARGLSSDQMQTIAREFNFSETTFVLPPQNARHTAHVRIFTPAEELLFAGHPTVGTAYLLADLGIVPDHVDEIVFEEGVGPVPVRIERTGDAIATCTLTAARIPESEPTAPDRASLARMLKLAATDVLDFAGCWSCGLPFLVIPLASVEALSRLELDLTLWREMLHTYATQNVFPVARVTDTEWRARMIAPSHGVAEDPATGSAAAAFAGWLSQHVLRADGRFDALIRQGIEMGRPSEIHLSLDRHAGRVTAVRVGGAAMRISEGRIRV